MPTNCCQCCHTALVSCKQKVNLSIPTDTGIVPIHVSGEHPDTAEAGMCTMGRFEFVLSSGSAVL